MFRSLIVLASLVRTLSRIAACERPADRPMFCAGVTWDASLPLAVNELDNAARSDYSLALGKLARTANAQPLCLESWKALQCASKFLKCSTEMPSQKVCRSLCIQFAVACNASDAVYNRCADDLLYDEPPCTDYADPTPRGRLDEDIQLDSSPAELFQTAAGLPLLLTLSVLLLHITCCAMQVACGSSIAGTEESETSRIALSAFVPTIEIS